MFTQEKLKIYHIFDDEKVSRIHNDAYLIDSNNNIIE